MHDALDFIARISWPLVALIGILILGPGGVLKAIIGELAEKLFRITDTIKTFKETANDFHQTQINLKESMKWVGEFQEQLGQITVDLKSVSDTTEQLAISEGSRSLVRAVETETEPVAQETAAEPASPEVLFEKMRIRWYELTEELKERIGQDRFDARSIGQMGWLLVDGRRARPITAADAELIERLHSQWKRFSRLQSNKDGWLSTEVFSAFIRGIDQVMDAL